MDDSAIGDTADTGPDLRTVDAGGRRLLIGTAHVLAGLMTLGLLEHAEGPPGLLGTLFPTAAGEERDRALFLAGAITGAAAAVRRRTVSAEALAAAQTALSDAGFEAMADLARGAAAVLGDEPAAAA